MASDLMTELRKAAEQVVQSRKRLVGGDYKVSKKSMIKLLTVFAMLAESEQRTQKQERAKGE